MPSIQIKNVLEDTHRVLQERAAASHQSLQEYLRSRLVAEASAPSLDEVLDRDAERTGSATFADTLELIGTDRDRG